MDLGIFAILFDGIGPPIIGAVDGMVAALQTWIRPILITGVVLYAVGKMVWSSIKGDGNPLGDTMAIMVAGSIFVYAATEAAGLGPQARNLLLNGLSNEISRIVLGAIGNRQIGANLFDDALGRAWASGLDVYNKLPGFSLKAIPLAFLVAVYWILALGCVAIAFFVWLTAFVMVALLVGFWPLGVGLFAFPWTRGFAWGWLRVTLSNCLLQILAVSVLSLILGSVSRILTQIAVNSGVLNEITNIGRLLVSSVVFGLLAWVAKQLPGLAAGWAHGFTGYGQTAFIRFPGSGGDQTSAPPPGSPQQQDQGQGQSTPGPSQAPPPQAPPPQSAIPRSPPPDRSIG